MVPIQICLWGLMKSFALPALIFAAIVSPVSAHTPYLVPMDFAPTQPAVTLHGSITDSGFFVPEFPFADGDFTVTASDGTITTANGLQLSQLSLFETRFTAEGTYRISTGNRDTRSQNMAVVEGKWRSVRASDITPDMKVIKVATMVRSDTYVSYKAPSERAPAPDGKGLEIVPLTHPNKVFAGQPFRYRVDFNGQPAHDVQWQMFRANDAYEDTAFKAIGQTPADGVLETTFDKPGIYIIEILRRWPQGDEGHPYVWLYSLTVEVTS